MLRHRRLAQVAAVLGCAALLLAPAAAVPAASAAPADECPWVGSSASAHARADQVLARMTLDEKLSMTHGSAVGGYAGVVAAIPRLCIPQLNLHDGGAGVTMGGTTAMPAPIAAAATFDPAVENAYGAVVGQEDRTKGVSINLGPNVNMERDPRGGRVFEGAGEDPYLTSTMTSGYIEGVQAQGVMADPKHFVGNDTEQNRNNGNAIVDDRTLNEIYYPPFKSAIQQAHAATVMAATSLVRGTHDNENHHLLATELKQDWGFDGFVVTDWDQARSTVQAANAELDLNMPSPGNFGEPLTRAVENGEVSINVLNDKVERLLTQEFSFGMFDRAAGSPGATATTPEHVQTAQGIGADGTVLMKNDDSALPLTDDTSSVAVIGAAADAQAVTGGGGSSHVSPASMVTPYQGIAKRLGAHGTATYVTGGWHVSAFAYAGAGDTPGNMVDNDPSTRWTSGTPMAPGQSITVDTGASRELDQITMDSASSTTDYARGYEVYLSTDDSTWGDPVATGTGSGPKIDVSFPEQDARYVKVVQTGNDSSWWSIAEFTASDKNADGQEVAYPRPAPLSVPGVTDTLPTVPAASFTTADGSPGLTASYYNNLTLAGSPALTRTEANIDDHYTEAPGPGVNAAGFSVRWTGYLTVPVTGTYDFSMKNTGGVRAWVDKQPVFTDWAQYGPGVSSIHLTAGRRLPITVENYQPINGASGPVAGTPTSTPTNGSITLGWKAPNTDAIAAAAAQARDASVAVVVVNDDESEDGDRQNLTLPGAQDDLIEAVAAANPHTVVVLNTGAPVLMPWLKSVPAVLESWYGGQQNGASLASVLFGDVDPSGKLPQTWPASMAQLPTAQNSRYPGTVDVSTNTTNYHYSEGLDIGYRWYDAHDLQPLFPFGYGLTYSTFGYHDLEITPNGAQQPGTFTVSGQVTNTGSRIATDVAQLYLGFPSAAGEPPKQLKGFDRVTLEPGATQQVTFTVTADDLRFWDAHAGAWSTATGHYQVWVGDSSRSLPLHGDYDLATSAGARTVTLDAAKSLTPGMANTVRQTLTSGGDQTLKSVRLALDLPAGWTATPKSPVTFSSVAPGTALHADWAVTPPAADQFTLRRMVGHASWADEGAAGGALQVAVGPQVRATLVSPVTSVRPGTTVDAALHLHNDSDEAVTVTPAITADDGLTVAPDVGPQHLAAGASTSVRLHITVGDSATSFRVGLSGTVQAGESQYSLGTTYLSRPLVLNAVADGYDNVGVDHGSDSGTADFDGSGYSYSAQTLADAGITAGTPVVVGNVQYTWPSVASGHPDNLVAAGQAVAVRGSGQELYLLGAASNGDGSGSGTIHYTDGSTQPYTLTLTNWTNTTPAGGNELVATAKGWSRPAGSSYPADEPVSVYSARIDLQAGKTVDYVELPSAVTGTQAGTQLHVFDMTLG